MTATPPSPRAILRELRTLASPDRLARLHSAGAFGVTLLTLIDEAIALTSTDPAEALAASNMLVDLADAAADPLARTRARHACARALAYGGRFSESLSACQQAIAIASDAQLPLEAGRAYLASMHPLGEQGHFERALDAGRTARAHFEAAGDHAFAARVDINLGIVHMKHDEPEAAVACLDRARAVLADDVQVLGHIENTRGEALLELNDFGGAEHAFRLALAAFEQAGQPVTAAIAEGNLADLATRQGRLQDALMHFEGARRRLDRNQENIHLARLLAEQAEAKGLLGVPAEALEEYGTALRELDQCGLSLEAARARCGMGLVLLKLDRPAEAATALAAAATAFEELGHTTARARVDLVRAELALDHGRAAETRRLATRALSVVHDRPADAAAARHVLARAAIALGEAEVAEADLAAAIAAVRPHGFAPLLANVLDTRGRLYRQQGRLDDAITDLTEALENIERVRGSLQADRFRAAFLGDRTATHQALVGALLDSRDPGAVRRAFGVSEQAKSRGLLDEVRGGGDREAPLVDDDPITTRLRSDLEHVHSELNALYSRVADDAYASSESLSRWQTQVRERERTLRTIETRLSAQNGLHQMVSPVLPVETIAATMLPDERLVEYFVADGSVTGFCLDHTGRVQVARHLVSEAEVAERLTRLQFQLERALRPGALDGPRSERLHREADLDLAAMYDLMLGPLEDAIGDAERLTFVPHGVLHLIPFAALRGHDRYVVEDHSITTVPSASIAAHLRIDREEVAATPPLIVGVTDDYIPEVDREVEGIAARLASSAPVVLTGDAATAESFLEHATRASLIHFAGHGRFLRDNPLASGLRLADRWITVPEICRLRLHAELVTLSACETGVNLVQAGDELVGLQRALFAAGAKALLASLWRVEDETSLEFMSRFYESRHTTDGGPHGPDAAAFRDTQRSLVSDGLHPALWAPFYLVGRS